MNFQFRVRRNSRSKYAQGGKFSIFQSLASLVISSGEQASDLQDFSQDNVRDQCEDLLAGYARSFRIRHNIIAASSEMIRCLS